MKSVIAVSSLVLLAMVGVSQAQFGGAPPPTEPAQGMDPTMMMMMVRTINWFVDFNHCVLGYRS